MCGTGVGESGAPDRPRRGPPIAFSYGKVDHDRADFLLALALLPTVAGCSTTDRRRSEAAGFVLRAVQLAAISTLLAPLIFVVSQRWRLRMVWGWYGFHAMVFATITIAFWPHLVVMLSFLPLELYAEALRAWWRRRQRLSDDLGERPPARQTWARLRIASRMRATASSTGTPLS